MVNGHGLPDAHAFVGKEETLNPPMGFQGRELPTIGIIIVSFPRCFAFTPQHGVRECDVPQRYRVF